MRKQDGKVVWIVIIIAAAVIALGVAGYFLWQHFINQESVDQADETVQVESAFDETGSSNGTTLTVNAWGLEGTYSNNDVQLAYTLNGSEIYFTDVRLADIEACGSAAAGVATRYTSDDIYYSTSSDTAVPVPDYYDQQMTIETTERVAAGKAGDYYLFYTGPQDECATDESTTTLQDNAVEAATEFITSITEV